MMASLTVVPIGTTGINVAPIGTTKISRGRPATGCAMSQSDRDRRCRAKKRFLRACAELSAAGLDPLAVLRASNV